MIAPPKNYYHILGISNSATPDQIKRAYRKLAMKYHPDHNRRKYAEDRFKALQRAYDTLSDPELRRQYDLRLAEVPSENQHDDVSVAVEWDWSELEPHVLPFILGAVVGAILGFSSLVKAYTPAIDSWVWGVIFIGGGAVIGGFASSIYFARKGYR